jgi:hypothetical protein
MARGIAADIRDVGDQSPMVLKDVWALTEG